MELAPGGVACAFEVTFDADNLDVGMSVYDITTGSAILVAGPSAMTHAVANTYFKSFTPTSERSYLIFKAVYTDNTFATLDTDYAAGTETIIAEDIGGGGGGGVTGGAVIGFIEPTQTVIGLVVC